MVDEDTRNGSIPDVLLVGETRDKETAHTAVEAALTGHLVFTTLHTNTPPADRDPARQHEVRRTVAGALSNDQRLRQEVAAPRAALELRTGLSRQRTEERHLVEE